MGGIDETRLVVNSSLLKLDDEHVGVHLPILLLYM